MTEDEMSIYTQFLADQKRLWDDLFKSYDPNLSAIYTSHKSEFLNQSKKIHHPPMMELKLTMAMLKLVDVVEVEEKVSFLFDYSSEWTDHRLKWDPYKYGGISHIYVPQKSIWLPEITIVDAQEVKFFESDDAPRTAWINYNGTVGFYTATVSSVICQLDVFKFPLDQHECGVSVLFHTYFPDEYRIKGGMVNIVKPKSELGNGEWKVTYVGVAEIPLSNDIIGSTTKFIARLERNPGFYISLVMIPAYCINFLTIIALFLDVENVMEKLNVGLTNIMAMTFILVILAADLPKTARIPLLAIYVIVGFGYCYVIDWGGSGTSKDSKMFEKTKQPWRAKISGIVKSLPEANYEKFLADQKRLWKDLFNDYDPEISAIYTLHSSQWIDQNNTIHPPILQLTLRMAMLKLVDVVEVEEKVTFIFDYTAEWTDHRLKWNPLEYGGISHIYVPQKAIWLPEVTIADAHEVKFFESDDAPRTAWIDYNGTVGFYTSTVSSVICQLDVFKFPMDQHECGVTVLFHNYFNDEYKIHGEMEAMAKPMSQLGNGEWKVTYVGVAEQDSLNPSLSSIQRFVARIERNPGFYVSLVMVPAYFINLLTIIALFMDIENVGEKISVGLTNIMAMTFILVILAADLPKTARILLLAIYVIVGLVIVMTSIFVVLLIPYFRKKWTSGHTDPRKSKIGKFWNNIEYILMFIFQLANLINFIILFV
ncbi:hypothetical protein L3Y34_006752 [Caenorhabditis briggsae]|uniref:Uncharacterized protein n=1 Tax=Caenorhabditis briggsae TaxID=6238 RepID=A0AAE9A509_CAEBR|nr:hypothetical protein L3Y34_006752 [Caenorhabditis briggsae]